MKKKILIICTGNSCRSQMAEGFLARLDKELEVFSAGTFPSAAVHPFAIKVMAEAGIDIANYKPKNVERFVKESFDFLITVCDDAKETCPVFLGKVRERFHFPFEDPAKATGTEEEIIAKFREVRNLIFKRFENFYNEKIKVCSS